MADSDSDDSIIFRPAAARRCFAIADDSSSSGEESDSQSVEIVGMKQVVTTAGARAAGQRMDGDSLFSDDSGSLEAMLENLALKADDKKEEIMSGESDESFASDSSDEQGDDDDASDIATENAVDSAWSFNTHDQEYFLSKRKDPSISWPNLRLPAHLFKSLYNHQKVGVQWMAKLHAEHIGGILGDDMGMGKTYTTAAFLGGLMRTRTIKNAVIVAPKSVLRSWEKELNRVVLKCVANTDIRVLDSNQSEQQRRRLLMGALECSPKRPSIVITTYGMVNNAQALFQSKTSHWDYVVLDEAHNVKNSKTQTSLACGSLASNPKTHRLMLSGTPLLNRPEELYSLISWCGSGRILGSEKQFKDQFARPITASRDKNATHYDIVRGRKAGDELQAIIAPYLLQRFKKDVLADLLPPKEEFVVWCHLSALQRQEYINYVQNDDNVQGIMAGEKRSPLESISWLKKLCGMPLLIDEEVRDDFKSELFRLGVDNVVQQSSKLGVLFHMVPEMIAKGRRILIFSQSTKMLDIIQFVLNSKIADRIARIDGSTAERNRQLYVDNFNEEGSPFDVMLLSTRAGGVGLTLTGADSAIIFDPDWTSALDAQAVDRCYRIGQKKEIVVYRLISAGTVEEKVYERQVHKEGINKAIQGGTDTVERHFSLSELAQVFVLGEAGVAKFMTKVNKEHEDAGIRTDWSRHTFLTSHPGVVGLSRHDALYVGIASSITPEEVENAVGTNKNLGRAQRVMQKTLATEPQPLTALKQPAHHYSSHMSNLRDGMAADQVRESSSWSSNAENTPSIPPVSKETALKTTSVVNSADCRVTALLIRANSLKAAGKPRKAFKELVTFLNDNGTTLSYTEKARLRNEIEIARDFADES